MTVNHVLKVNYQHCLLPRCLAV